MESLVYEREIDLGYIYFSIIVKVVEKVLKRKKQDRKKRRERKRKKIIEFTLRILRPTKKFFSATIRPIFSGKMAPPTSNIH